MDYPDYSLELLKHNDGYKYIVGVDEVGRGAGFSAVVASAVYIPPDALPELIGKANDSKKLSPRKRENLCKLILRTCDVGIWQVENDVIDDINIYNATKLAMCEAIRQVKYKDFVLVDGNMKLDDINVDQQCVISGDSISVSIACASIVAKVTRDSLIQSLHPLFPYYGLDKNKGYLTKQHRDAIKEYGITKYHRKSFRGVE
jgi:ribonuclease HII